MPGGGLIRCHRDSSIASSLHYFGPFTEWDELLFLTRYLRPGDGVIDGGANIGLYSVLAAPIVGTGGRVDAIEATPDIVSRLAENVTINSWRHVHVHHAALASAAGEIEFALGRDVSNHIEFRDVDTRNRPTVTVRAATLDELALGTYSYGKLDVEGAEFLALSGAGRLLSTHNPPVWQLEVEAGLLKRFGSTPVELLELLKGHGFVVAIYDGDSNELTLVDSPAHNVLAIATEHLPEVRRRLNARRS